MPYTNIILDLICFAETFVWSILFFIRQNRSYSFVYAGQIFLGISVIFLFLCANQLRFLSVSLVLNFFYPFILPYILIMTLFYLRKVFKSRSQFPFWYSLLFILPVLVFAIYIHAFYFHYPLKEIIRHFYELLDSGSNQETFKLIDNARKMLFWIFDLTLIIVVVVQVKLVTAIVRRRTKQFSIKRPRLLVNFRKLLILSIILEITTFVYMNFPGWHVVMRLFFILVFFILGRNIFYSLPKKYSFNKEQKPYVDDQLKLVLLEYFEESKPWLNPGLKEEDVIQHMRTNRTYFWKLLHKDLNTNFNALVNHYRMKEVLRILDQERKISMLELVERTGFKSYSTFFKVFYKEKGMAPSEYVKRNDL